MLHTHYIDGAWAAAAESMPNVDPSDTSRVIGDYALGTIGDVEAALAAARAAFPGWSRSNIQTRFDILDAIGTEILARREELGTLLAAEEGKTRAEGIGEVVRAGSIFKFFAGEALRISGDRLASVREGIDIELVREPVGIVGIITPWNFPIAIPAWKIAPAIAFGNCVVFKPAELVPASAWALAEIISRTALPPGVFNMVMGRGSELGPAIIAGSNAVTFTGSVETGRSVAANAVQRFAKVQLEMGGKSPLIVLDDAHLETAVECAANGAFFMTGQRCTASSRLVVTEGIHDRFVAALEERMRRVRVGPALDPASEIGPVVDQRQLDQDLRYIGIAEAEGARRAFGGEVLARESDGFFLSPCLLTETRNDMRVNREEIFGPVASVIRVRDYDEALAVANDTPFGLSSGICTSSLKHATHFRAHSGAGVAMVNLPTSGIDYHAPFGGRKESSYGPREQGGAAVDFYTVSKTCYTRADCA